MLRPPLERLQGAYKGDHPGHLGPRLGQRAAACGGRGPGGEDVVHQEDRPRRRHRTGTHPEAAARVLPPLGASEPRLPTPSGTADEHTPDRPAELAGQPFGQQLGLVEAPLPEPGPGEGDGHQNRSGGGRDLPSDRDHRRCHRPRRRPPPSELERPNQPRRRALHEAGRPGSPNASVPLRTLDTPLRPRQLELTGGAAPPAPRTRHPGEPMAAERAQGARPGRQRGAADEAHRREECVEELADRPQLPSLDACRSVDRGGASPNHRRREAAAWRTSISRPSSARIPSSSACDVQAVPPFP